MEFDFAVVWNGGKVMVEFSMACLVSANMFQHLQHFCVFVQLVVLDGLLRCLLSSKFREVTFFHVFDQQ